MPNLDNSVQLSETYSVLASSYAYDGLTGIDDTRSHKSQLIFLYRYATLADGTAVADVTWKNWYDPYLIPENVITINQGIKDVQVGDTTTTLLVDASGNTYNMPAFTLGGGQVFEIQRSQDVDNRVVIFGAGSRVTAQGLNNAVDQLFKSVQELDSRTTIVESGETQGSGGGGGSLTPGNYGDVIVNVDGSFSVVDDSHNHVINNVDGLQAALDAKLTGIVAGTNVTVSDNGDGTFTVNASASSSGGVEEAPNDGQQYARESEGWSVVTGGSGAPPELTASLTVSDPVGPDQTVGQVYALGTDLEVIIRDMLVSYQVPDVSNITNPNPTVSKHGVNLSFSLVSFSLANPSNINASVQGAVNFITPSFDSNDATQAFTYNGSSSQTVTMSASAGGVVTNTNPGATGTDKQQTGFKLQVTGTDSQGTSFERTESWTIRFESYFGNSAVVANGSNGSTIIADLVGSLSADSMGTETVPTQSGTDYTYFIMPKCHWDDVGNITYNGAIAAYTDFTEVFVEVINGVTYSIIRNSTVGGYTAGDTLEVS